MFNDEQKTIVAKAIFENIGKYECPVCKHPEFSIVPEFGLHLMRPIDNPNNVSWGVPYVMLLCGKCGYMSQHNAISLGVIDAKSARELMTTFDNFDKI